jgi:hypothetical protein
MLDKKLVLPEVGDDWLEGLVGKYIIVSLKHSTKELTMFWRANCLGYTCSMLNAGKYDKATIEGHMMYYNDGLNSMAVPCTQAALETLGIFTVLADYDMNRIFLSKEIADTQE